MPIETLNEEIKFLLESNKNFVLFKKPNNKSIKLYSQENNRAYTSGFVISDFNNTEKHYVYPEKKSTFSVDNYNPNHPVLFKKIKNPSILSTKEKSKEAYVSMIKSAIKELKDDFIKIVLSRVIKWKYEDFNELNHFIQLSKNNPNAFVYLIYISNKFCWLGASPELLISYKNKNLSTVSLAGTKKKEDSWTSKEYEEQQMVTDYIIQIAEKNQIAIAKGETMTIEASSEIVHLKTLFTATDIDYKTAKEFLLDLHPTSAVCGVPKEKAINVIRILEGYERSFYAGYIGLQNEKEMELYVNLRCASVSENNISVYVGGGITKKSDAEKEWNETELKSKTIKFEY